MPESRQTAKKDKKDILLQDTHCCLHEGNEACTKVEFHSGMSKTVYYTILKTWWWWKLKCGFPGRKSAVESQL